MPEGTVEVELLKGHDLKDVEFFGKSDPYAVISFGQNYGIDDQTSSTIEGGGSSPVWNECFLFQIPDGPHQLTIAVFDKEKRDSGEAMGTVLIDLGKLFAEGKLHPAKYPVQLSNGKFKGELEVGLKFFPKVHQGTLTVHLLEAHGLLDTDTFGKSDPYAVIDCHGKIQKSSVLQGSNPVWDEPFEFEVDSAVTEVVIKLFDKDDVKADDILGTVKIPLQKVFLTGHVPPLNHKVLGKLGQLQGEISVGLKFIPKL